ncbi:hypothetical protein HU200_023855 [Digitaria exilis]|uniref:Adipocyte plasma membrane-associated protein n=1 Tax=Digitaria exilis TaxID=1010633 RepID=A0A835EYA1_9POAL|nr:hypothetical protein HU200_023855 [Digitaria exilis]
MCDAFSELPPVATESSCGRPLGLRFHKNSGSLYIADAYMGLMRVGPNGGEATVLATKAGGLPLRFTNGVDIDQVTAQHEMVTSSGDSTGRIMNTDRTHLVVALTGPCKLLKYWIRGPKANTSEPFADLPGYPDNVRSDGKAIRIGAEGEKLQEMKGHQNVRPTEAVERTDGKIYLGSVELSYVGIVNP